MKKLNIEKKKIKHITIKTCNIKLYKTSISKVFRTFTVAGVSKNIDLQTCFNLNKDTIINLLKGQRDELKSIES